MYIYLNDRLVPRSEARVSVFDHGFLYGDGIYETMRSYDGVVFMLDEHIRRLYRSAGFIGLNIPADADALKVRIFETLSANKRKNAYIRLTISRGPGPIGLDPDLCPEPTLVIMTEPLKEYPQQYYEQGIRAIIPATRRNLPEAINPQVKSLNFLNNILAKVEARRHGALEAIMLGGSGRLTEGTISNIFFYKDNTLCTPSVECGILDGITRGVVLSIARREDIAVKEGVFSREDIYSASEAFITNTTMEVMPLKELDEKLYSSFSVSGFLRTMYGQDVEAYVAGEKEKGPSLWGYNE